MSLNRYPVRGRHTAKYLASEPKRDFHPLFDQQARTESRETTAPTEVLPGPAQTAETRRFSDGKGYALTIIEAIKALKTVESEQRACTPLERSIIAKFGGFGPVALSLFPKPNVAPDDKEARFAGYKDAGWQAIDETFRSLLTPRRIRVGARYGL